MDSSTRIILSIIFGSITGYFIGKYIPLLEPYMWGVLGAIIGIATDTTLRTMKNVKIKPNLGHNSEQQKGIMVKKVKRKPPVDPRF